jgi:hypothetical protein
VTGKNRIMIYGPKDDGTYVVEFKTADGDALAISIPRTEAHVIRHFQERMPYGLFVPEVPLNCWDVLSDRARRAYRLGVGWRASRRFQTAARRSRSAASTRLPGFFVC